MISYRLYRPAQNYTGLDDAIRNISGTYLHATTSAWIVETNQSTQEVFNRLSPFIDGTDELVVYRLQRDWWGRFTDPTWHDWLKARIF